MGNSDNINNMNHSPNLISFVRICCRVFEFRALDSNTARWKVLLWNAIYGIYCVSEIYGTLAIINGLNCCFTSFADSVESFVEMIFMLEVLFNFIYYRRRMSQFQRLITEMERFFESSNPGDKRIRLSYVKVICCVMTIIFCVGALLFAFAPLFADSKVTPLNTVYIMIPRNKYWGLFVTYGINIVHIIVAISVIFLDLLLILIMWHAACEFRLIGCALENVNARRLKAWIRRHQNVICYTEVINRTVGPLAVKSTIAVALYMIISGLVVTHDLPLYQLMKFIVVTTLSLLRFLACSWAADTMTENARNIAWKIYELPWINMSPKTRKDKLMIMQRCQKPITIHAKGIVTAWSLKFCGQVLYTIFTFFSTLRAVLHV